MSGKAYFRFEKLEIWSDARKLVSTVYKVTSKFSEKERFGLVNQLRRAAVSIVLNIAEGSTRGSDADFKRFLKMSQGSLHEVIAAMYLSLDQGFIKSSEFDKLYQDALLLNARLIAFSKKL